MSMLTSATRMYLTRSFRPFTFLPDDGARIPDLTGTSKPGLYVHIPFCRSICDFCPYCKTLFDRARYGLYIAALKAEIELFSGGFSQPVTVSSLYFGGGSPALAADDLGGIIRLLRKYYTITDGIGIELHPDDMNADTLRKLKDAGVTRISIGVQSFQPHCQALLCRRPVDAAALKRALEQVPFETVSMDFIFALPGQSPEDLKADVRTAFDNGANHVAIYPFINFSFAPTPVNAATNREKRRLLDDITAYFRENGCYRDSIWTFTRDPAHRYSSMTRDNFIGFGCSATTLLQHQFRVNTFSVDAYCKRIAEGRLPTALRCDFTERQRMVYWLFWRLYTTRLASADFEAFFGVPLKKAFGAELAAARLAGMLREHDGMFELTGKGAFYFHYYEGYYTLAYIDKMWGLLRENPFPAGMTL